MVVPAAPDLLLPPVLLLESAEEDADAVGGAEDVQAAHQHSGAAGADVCGNKKGVGDVLVHGGLPKGRLKPYW